jgi:hypothetical protein
MRLDNRIRTLERVMAETFERWLKSLTDDQLAEAARGWPGDIDLSTLSDAELDRLAAGEVPVVVLGWRCFKPRRIAGS